MQLSIFICCIGHVNRLVSKHLFGKAPARHNSCIAVTLARMAHPRPMIPLSSLVPVLT